MTCAAFASESSAPRARFSSWPRLFGGGRRPEYGVEIAIPAVNDRIDATADDQDAFSRKMTDLFAKGAATRRKCDAAIGAQHAKPRQIVFERRAEHAADESRATRQACARRDFAVACDRAARNRADHAHDAPFGVRAVLATSVATAARVID